MYFRRAYRVKLGRSPYRGPLPALEVMAPFLEDPSLSSRLEVPPGITHHACDIGDFTHQ